MSAASIDQVEPKAKWEFDEQVTAAFDDMLSRSIPLYPVMRSACADLAFRFAQRGTDIVDLGCSRGGAIAELIDRLGCANRFIGCDVSEPMLDAARQRFKGFIDTGVVSIEHCDLRESFPACRASVIQSVLTLQFTPIEYRQRIVANIYNHLQPGGAFILVEKILGDSTSLDETFVKLYYDLKTEHQYTREQIEKKRRSLEGVLVPLTADFNVRLLRSCGFSEVDCFWRWCNFAGWVAIKPKGAS